MNLETLLEEGSRELGINLVSAQTAKFLTYLELIKKWNNKINLTSITEDKEIIVKHFLDSLTVSGLINDGSEILDIGTGAGFPGIPLSIVRDTLKIKVLDSREKRIFFINEILRELELRNTDSAAVRAEDINNGVPRNQFDYVVTRAVGNIDSVLGMSVPYIKDSGKIILMRGKEGKTEWKNSDNNYNLLELKELTIPKSDFKRTLIVISRKR